MTDREHIECAVEPIAAMDGWQVQNALNIGWLDPTRQLHQDGVICYAEVPGGTVVGTLALDARGKVLMVEVEPDWRRQGIATRMYETLLAEGHKVVHDWDNMRDDGAAWVASLGEES